jgi:hypothetical protein
MQINEILQAGARVEFQEPADFFRILAAPSIAISVEFYRNGARIGEATDIGAGYAESFAQPFDKLIISSSVTQAVKLVTRLGNDVRYDTPPVGNVTITGTPHVIVDTMTAINRQENPFSERYGATYASAASQAANTPDTVFTPGANVNGAIVHRAMFEHGLSAGSHSCAYVAKTSAPATPADGAPILNHTTGFFDGTNYYRGGYSEGGIFIPAGCGLYFICSVAEFAALRSVLYTLL